MADPKKPLSANPSDASKPSASGQQKLHTITNTSTGETKQVTQEDWRLNGAAYRAAGWTRPEDADVEPPEPPAV